MATVQTARGIEVDTSRLGFTLMHEHLISPDTNLVQNWPHLFNRHDEVIALAAQLQSLHMAGVRSIVDLTTGNMGRDAALLKEVAMRTDLHIIAATGTHLNLLGYFRRPTVDPIVDLYVRDINVGIADTGVRAAILKIATEKTTPEDELQLRAVALAHRATGVPISTHHNSFELKNGLHQQSIFAAEGVDLSRVIIGHSGDTTDLDYLMKMLDAGSTIGMDRFGARIPAITHEERCQTVADLCKRGYASQMVLSHDAAGYSMRYGSYIEPRTRPHVLADRLPEFNFFHVPVRVLTTLRQMGVAEEHITAMTTDNPRRIFETQGAY